MTTSPSTFPIFRLYLAVFIFFLLCSCEKNVMPDAYKDITSFSLKKQDGSAFLATEVTVIKAGNTINITVPGNTNLDGLVPEITIKGVTISPASGLAQNFNNPITYTVTAEDGSTANYVVIIQKSNLGSIVYIGSSDSNFYALDALTGSLVWKFKGNGSFAFSGATYANNTIFVGCVDSYVYAFDALTGAVKWKYLAGNTGIESDAVVVNGTVYVGSNDDYLYALDAVSGQLKWQYLTGANVSASPTISNGVVYFGSSDGNLYALNASDGSLKWSFGTGDMINQSGPAISNGVVFVGSRSSELFAVDAATGSLKWSYSTNGISLEQSSPTIANGLVYIGGWYNVPSFSMKGSLYAINENTGQLVWESLVNTGISSSPTISDGRAFITSDDLSLHAIDAATGAPIWEKQILANSASPAVSNGTVYVGGGGTWHIYAFDAVTGAEKWRFNTPKGLSTSCPLIVSPNGEADYSGDSGMKD